MKKFFQLLFLLISLTIIGVVVSSFNQLISRPHFRFPYQKAGLSQREAATHILNRFSYGATPGQVDEVVKEGIEDWFEQQLKAGFSDDALNAKLSTFQSLHMNTSQIVHTYPKGGELLKMAIKDGVIDKDSARIGKQVYNNKIRQYMEEKGMQPQANLLRELYAQKILRAAYSQNQLLEVMTDFWFNHFNVAISKNGVTQFVTAYERDVIRPNALGKFENLLLATAKSPAMLTYLDNNRSTASEQNMTQVKRRKAQFIDSISNKNNNGKIRKPKMQGLNENYAREIMELHTLGVDGGYTQADVTEAARVLTGWCLNPEIEYGIKPGKQANEERLKKMGYVKEGDFLFAANKHDRGQKKVLGVVFPAGEGYEEGVKLVHMLANHPSTAKFISRKLAIRFVSDHPSQGLIDKMAKTFLAKNGDIKEVLITMVTAKEFWGKEAIREKTKSPFELAISAVRSTNAQISSPYALNQWIGKMGQRLYNYQAPTGYPDKGTYWINTGSLLNRMNFGLALASGRLPGVKVNLLSLNQNHEPESAEAALDAYAKLLLPERNIEETTKRLIPLLNDPGLSKKVNEAAGGEEIMKEGEEVMSEKEVNKKLGKGKPAKKLNGKKDDKSMLMLAGDNTMLSQVVGIIIGSPEFQRR